MTLKIAIAQSSPHNGPLKISPEDMQSPSYNVFSNIIQNLSIISRAAEDAKAQGDAELVAFPEYFTQGSLDGRSYLAEPAAWILEYLQNLAERLDISIAGTIVELEDSSFTASQPQVSPFGSSDNNAASQNVWTQFIRREYPEISNTDQLGNGENNLDHHRSNEKKDLPSSYSSEIVSGSASAAAASADAGMERDKKLINVAYFIQGGTGEIIGRYVKKNLWISEREYLHPGIDDHSVFTWNGITVGFLICWDLAHPLAAQALAKRGVDLIIVPTYWLETDSQPSSDAFDPPKDYEYNLLQSLSYTRAFETETALVMCNAGPGVAPGLMGGSGVWMPFKGKLKGQDLVAQRREKEGGDDATELCGYEVDLGLLPVARETYKIREDWKAQLEAEKE